jgi:nitroimidazol reductase NimA-like FMN-containing flavoprotein (pyridoxamine 5'-phosphate oxidase superfamily)
MHEVSELTTDECLLLLRSRRIGRVALRAEVGLRIFPISYAMHGDDIVFRTVPYGVIASSPYGAEVAFEVDELDEETQSGWSVLAVGSCRRVEVADEIRLLREHFDPEPWLEGRRNLYFRIAWEELSGRRFGLGPTLVHQRSASEPLGAEAAAPAARPGARG